MNTLLKIENLECVYQKYILAITGISLTLKENQIVALLGTNGAGKTTAVRCILGKGLLKPLEGKVTKGNVVFNGKETQVLPTSQVVSMGISLVPEGRGIFEDLTVEENLKVGAHSRSTNFDLSAEFDKVYHYFPVLENRRKGIAGYLSGGEQQMLAIGRALMSKPILLILDEPSLGLAPMLVDEIFSIIKSIRDHENVSVLVIEQNATVAFEVADYAYIMENGSMMIDGTPDILKESAEVKEFYLGISSTGRRKDYRDVKSYKKRRHWFS